MITIMICIYIYYIQLGTSTLPSLLLIIGVMADETDYMRPHPSSCRHTMRQDKISRQQRLILRGGESVLQAVRRN